MRAEVLALIPARGGSKGIPRKNIIDIAGRPLIEWTVEQALASERITRVVVSTDDEEIAEVATGCGAEVPFLRPAEFAGDESPDVDVMRHALVHFAGEGYDPEMVVHLRPSGPVRRVQDIDAAVDLLAADPDADSLRSVTVAEQSPYKMWSLRPDGTLAPLLSVPGLADAQSMPRQVLPVAYWQNGYVDVFRPRAVLEHGSMQGAKTLAFVVTGERLDLDYPSDIPAVEEALSRVRDGIDGGIDIDDPTFRHSV